MSDRMRPIPFAALLDWISTELKTKQTIFGIPEKKFYRPAAETPFELFGDKLETPLGPSAGPHTQLAQNIVASYLTGGRFIELKTVQILDALEFPKPCIYIKDECYNTEWSQELSLEASFAEYVKAWFLLHLLQKELFGQHERRFLFNMSVGYTLEGIKSEKVDRFIEGLKDASGSAIFQECQNTLLSRLADFPQLSAEYVKGISPQVCNSIALSTMHGCPPDEIEAICRYLLREKKLHTLVKMNPTLLGFPFVRDGLEATGYGSISLKEESFTHDLQYVQGIDLLKRVKEFADAEGKVFGVKLSNTLPVRITEGELPGEEMYMSGRALYPLTVSLAFRVALEFDGHLTVAYSGGVDRSNIEALYRTGIGPITVTSLLLKPHGYYELRELAELLRPLPPKVASDPIELETLRTIAFSIFQDQDYSGKAWPLTLKTPGLSKGDLKSVDFADCFCLACSEVCPNRANIVIKHNIPGQKALSQIVHLDGFCNECGTCVFSCPRGNIPYRDKFTLFWSEADFAASSNPGVLWVGAENKAIYKIRLNDEVKEINLDEVGIQGHANSAFQIVQAIREEYEYLFCRQS